MNLLVVLDTTKVQIFKQITTALRPAKCNTTLFQIPQRYRFSSKSQRWLTTAQTTPRCFRYHKGTDFQANHNSARVCRPRISLFQIPQRYRFSSKSQPTHSVSRELPRCFRYHKGTDFQANHNYYQYQKHNDWVVLDTTKVQIFKQITTDGVVSDSQKMLFQIPQRYRFSSKSQLLLPMIYRLVRCFRYHKGTDFQANHNLP